MENNWFTEKGKRDPEFWDAVEKVMREEHLNYSWLAHKLGAEPNRGSYWAKHNIKLIPRYRQRVLDLLGMREEDIYPREELEEPLDRVLVTVQVRDKWYQGYVEEVERM